MPYSHLHIMIKPASSRCNMRCQYCFYADEAGKRKVADFGIMSEATLRNVMEKSLAQAGRQCAFSFQGGEPTLAGLAFFEAAVRYAQELNKGGCRISFALQTNGLALDAAWCAFLKRHDFLVGVSLDGPRALHDSHRLDAHGKGTHDRVIEALHLLQQHSVPTNILTVVTAATAQSFAEVYAYFDAHGFAYQQYIPCLDPLRETRGAAPWSLLPSHMEQYLKAAFDCWAASALRGDLRYHRYFDNLMGMLQGQPAESCGMQGVCGVQYVVEGDGSAYPCDFYALDTYRLGNLNEDSFAQLDARREEIGFVSESATDHADCLACEWRALCRGGCRRDRDWFEQGIGLNYYCEAYKAFFAYAYPRMRDLLHGQ